MFAGNPPTHRLLQGIDKRLLLLHSFWAGRGVIPILPKRRILDVEFIPAEETAEVAETLNPHAFGRKPQMGLPTMIRNGHVFRGGGSKE
jgi:hypothetical protein